MIAIATILVFTVKDRTIKDNLQRGGKLKINTTFTSVA